MADAYDVRTLPFGESFIAEACAAMNEDYKASIRQVASTNSLPDFLQLPCASTPELMTLGELAATAKDEEAEQFFDERALRKILIGRYGIAKSSQRGLDHCRLALPIQVSFFRPPFTEPLTRPIISSGRHRLLATQILLLAAGVGWDVIQTCNLRITSVVIADDYQFSQLMENNNTSRNQSRHELKVHALSGKGIPTGDVESLLEFNYRCNDAATQSEFFSQLVALMAHGTSDPEFAFNVAASAWSSVKQANRQDRAWVRDFFADADDLESVAKSVANAIPAAEKAARANPLAVSLTAPVAQELSRILAKKLDLKAPEFPSFEEVAQARLQRQKEKVEELERALQQSI